jgi:hypothetical protein
MVRVILTTFMTMLGFDESKFGARALDMVSFHHKLNRLAWNQHVKTYLR